MKLTKKLKIKISKKDADRLEKQSNLCRVLYNTALEQRIMVWKGQRKSLSVYDQKKELPELKDELPEFKQIYNKYLSETLFRLENTFKSFFQRCKEGKEKKGFPRFRGKHYFFTLTCSGMYIKRINSKTLQLPQKIIVKTYEDIPNKFGEVNIIKKNGQWYVTLVIEVEETIPDKLNNGIIGIDLGLKKLVTGVTTDNKIIERTHRKPTRKELNRLDNLRSKRDRCIKGSRRYNFLTFRLKKEGEKWRNRMIDWLHKVSYFLTNQTERILVIGKLDQRNMISENKKLNRYVQNEWRLGKFKEFLKYKCKKFGKELVEIDERYTTQDCFICGKREKKLLSQRKHKCECGFEIDRDINSSLNILKRYLLGLSHVPELNKFWDYVLEKSRNLNIAIEEFEYI